MFNFTVHISFCTEAENGHGFLFFFYALLSRDNDLLSRYLDITKIVFS